MKRALTSLGGLDVGSSSATYLCHEVGEPLDLLGSHPRSVENPAVVRLLVQLLSKHRIAPPSPPCSPPLITHSLSPTCPSSALSALFPARGGAADLPWGAHCPVCRRALLKGIQAHPSWPAATQGASALSPSALHLSGTHHLEVPSALVGALQYLLPHHSSGACFFLHGCPSSALASSSD